MNVLIIGGSGFVSGTMAREALAAGHDVWAVTRGRRPLPEGARPIVADRTDRAAFQQAIDQADALWDLVIDCIGFNADDARQDVELFEVRGKHLVFISTDFVYDPVERPWCVNEQYDRFDTSPYGRGKRNAEQILLRMAGDLPVTILRPCHIYGPGAQLGCLPLHGRDPELLDRMRRREALRLVGGGHFLQQPVFVTDLARMALSCWDNGQTHGEIYLAAGPEVIESWRYYRIIADILGVELKVEEVPVSGYLAEHPEHRSFCAHRVYDMDKAERAGLAVPETSMADGLKIAMSERV
jgi:nucleoside-diphosphate-sugar epimerase